LPAGGLTRSNSAISGESLTHRRIVGIARQPDFLPTCSAGFSDLQPLAVDDALDNFVAISGCSGGGKSTLLRELGRRGYTVVEEPGRRIVRLELAKDGSALPWVDPAAFLRRAIEMALQDRTAVTGARGWVFFDRGLVDAAAGLQHVTAEPALQTLCQTHRYNRCVFLAPPWPEIYRTDRERRHSLDEALGEYERLCEIYPALGYEVCFLPKAAVQERADFVLAVLNERLMPRSAHPPSA
jgi:predicted ATPase